jgi:ElaB/YqjD/DUF883 family membrane-anchored ribosome-binding protein
MFSTPFEPESHEPTGPLDTRRWTVLAEEWITNNPGVALGAALTVGVLIGWLVKRK